MIDAIRTAAFVLLGSEPDLNGVWVRHGDNFAGCQVQIEPIGNQLQGTLVFVPQSMRTCGWSVGDQKWVDIEAVQRGRYQTPRSL